jgi:hypothetical protein
VTELARARRDTASPITAATSASEETDERQRGDAVTELARARRDTASPITAATSASEETP